MDVTPRDAASRSAGRIECEPLVLGDRGEHALAPELPGGFLTQDAGRLARLVGLDHAAGDAEVAVRERQGGRVEPERVAVARDQRDRRVRRDCVEVVLRRLDRGRPVAAPPAATADPGAAWGLSRGLGYARDRLLESRRVVELDLVLRERPEQKVDVRVGEPRQDAAAAEVDALGARERRFVRADAARDPLARDRERRRLRQRRLHRAHDAVLENHTRILRRRDREPSESSLPWAL